MLIDDEGKDHLAIKNDITELGLTLKSNLVQFKADIVKWMAIFWTATVISISVIIIS